MRTRRKVLRVPGSQLTVQAGNFGGAPMIIPLDRDEYLWGVDVHILGRLAVGVADGAYVNAEVPQNIVRQIRVRMSHEIYGSNRLVQSMMGATLHARARMHQATSPLARITPAAAVTHQKYDFEVHYPVVFPIENLTDLKSTSGFGGKGGGWIDAQSIMFGMLDAPRCSDLTLELDLAAGTDLIAQNNAATATYAFTSYGADTGVPQIIITELVVEGLAAAAPKTALVTKIARTDLLENNVTLNNRNANEFPLEGSIARVLLKQYAQDAGSAAPCAQTMLSPKTAASAGITAPQFFVKGVAVHEWDLWAQLEAQNKADYHVETWPAGYGLIDFIEDGKATDALFTQDLAAKKSIVGYGGLINGNAGQRVEVVIEQINPNPKL